MPFSTPYKSFACFFMFFLCVAEMSVSYACSDSSVWFFPSIPHCWTRCAKIHVIDRSFSWIFEVVRLRHFPWGNFHSCLNDSTAELWTTRASNALVGWTVSPSALPVTTWKLMLGHSRPKYWRNETWCKSLGEFWHFCPSKMHCFGLVMNAVWRVESI